MWFDEGVRRKVTATMTMTTFSMPPRSFRLCTRVAALCGTLRLPWMVLFRVLQRWQWATLAQLTLR